METFTFDQFAGVLNDPLLLVSSDGVIRKANTAAADLLGMPPQRLRDAPLTLVSADPPEEVADFLRLCSRSGRPVPGVLRVVSNGGITELRCDGSRLRAAESGENLILLRCRKKSESTAQFAILNRQVDMLAEEITRRKRLQLELASQRQWLQVTLQSIGDAVITADRDLRITLMNPASEALTGWSQREAAGRPLAEVFRIINERTGEAMESPAEEVIRTGRVVGLANHTALIDRAEQARPIEDSAAPIRDERGEVIGVVMVFHDVSERRKAEREAAAYRRWLEVTLQSIGDAVIATDPDQRVSFFNPAAEQLTGWPTAEAVGRPLVEVFNIVNEVTGEPAENPVDKVLRTGRVVGLANHTSLIARDGSFRPIEDSAAPIRDEDGHTLGVVMVFHDVTERRKAERELKKSHQRIKETLERIGDAFVALDKDWRITFVNPVLLRILDRPAEELIGRNVWDLFPQLKTSHSARLCRRAMKEQRPLREEVLSALTDRWFDVSIYPSPDGLAIYARDIDEQKKAREAMARHREELERVVNQRTEELEISHQRLRMAERMSALGTLSAGLGHDMGNLLLPIRARLDTLEHRNLPGEFREDIDAIGKCVEYLQRLSTGLRLFALNPEEAPQTVEPTDLVDWWMDIEPLMQNGVPRHVTLEGDLPRGLPAARMSRAALTQAVFNLVQNAGQAMRKQARGRIRIWARADPDNSSIRLGVTDNGPGMDGEVRQRCMEPFYTTRTREISTGLGLALVHGLVQRVGGQMEIESEPGRGATFVLRLSAEAPAAASGSQSRTPALRMRLTIGDPRRLGVVRTLLRSLPVHVTDEADAAASIWVTDAHSADVESLKAFVEGDPRARVLVLGGSPPPRESGTAASEQVSEEPLATRPGGAPGGADDKPTASTGGRLHDRIIVAPDASRATLLRQALHDLVQAMTDRERRERN